MSVNRGGGGGIPVYIDIRGENRKVFDDVVDTVLKKVLEEEDEADAAITPVESRASSAATTTPSPLSINQLLSSSYTPPAALPAPMALNPFQLALYQSLSNNPLPFPVFGGVQPIFPLFVPPPQPAVESADLLRIFQNILSKQKK